jgi:hypothetical protein
MNMNKIFCRTCGRIISRKSATKAANMASNATAPKAKTRTAAKRNTESEDEASQTTSQTEGTPQKYCSHACRTKKPGPFDWHIENVFLSELQQAIADSNRRKALRHDGVECEHVQQVVTDGKTEEFGKVLESLQSEDAQRQGILQAQLRERVRRAARRLVVDPQSKTIAQSPLAGSVFECVQAGKSVDGSFAKGPFGIRPVE